MIPFGGLLSDEEIWTVMPYERSFAGGHGRRGMRKREEVGPMDQGGKRRGRGQHGGMGQMEHHERMGGGECCDERGVEN